MLKIRSGSFLSAVLLAAALAGCQSQQHAPRAEQPTTKAHAMETGLLFRTVQVDGVSQKFAVYVPRSYDASKPWPAIVFLHGFGESGTDGVKQCSVGLLPAVLNQPDRWPFIVIAPQKPEFEPLWDKYDAFVMAALDQTMRELNIDADRVYLTGLSQGGFGTWTLGAMHPDRFAALAPVCGFGDDAFVGPRVKNLPIWAFHGLKDNVVSPEKTRKLVNAVKAAQAADATKGAPEPKLTEFPNADHNSWDSAYRGEKLGALVLQYTRKHS